MNSVPLLDQVSSRVESFIERYPAFQDACQRCFCEADKDDSGALTFAEVVEKVDDIFNELEDVLNEAQIEVERPTREKIKALVREADVDGDEKLDEFEFMMFYKQVLKLGAYNSARGFCARHGPSILAGLASIVTLQMGKDKIEVPKELTPYVNLLVPVVSIVVGMLAKAKVTNKRKQDAEKKLFRCETFKAPKSD